MLRYGNESGNQEGWAGKSKEERNSAIDRRQIKLDDYCICCNCLGSVNSRCHKITVKN